MSEKTPPSFKKGDDYEKWKRKLKICHILHQLMLKTWQSSIYGSWWWGSGCSIGALLDSTLLSTAEGVKKNSGYSWQTVWER